MRPFISHPTLEPSLTEGNESVIGSVLDDIDVAMTEAISVQSIDELFKADRSIKGSFAAALALRLEDPLTQFSVPKHIRNLFDFLYDPADRMTDDEAID